MATHLADKSALGRLHHADVATRLEAMFLAGRIATTGLIDLEMLYSAHNGDGHRLLRDERRLLPRVPTTEAACELAVRTQGRLADLGRHRISVVDLVIAAVAEIEGLTVLHYDHDFELIASVTGQPTEWVLPVGTVP